MFNTSDILETITMIQDEHLDIRTVTMGISLTDCFDSDAARSCVKIEKKIEEKAAGLVPVCDEIQRKYGIPIINKRISVTPVSLAVAASGGDPVLFAKALDRVAAKVGVNFIGGFSALVQKGFSPGDKRLIDSIPEALATTERVCSSVNIGSTKAGIKRDAVLRMV
jgi:uncharacterized protein (UPF0210 family)